MSMCILIEYSNNYLKTSKNLWQYYRDETALYNAGAITIFPGKSLSFTSNVKITGKTTENRKHNEVAGPLKYH